MLTFRQMSCPSKSSAGARGVSLLEALLAMTVIVVLGLSVAIAIPSAMDSAREEAVRDRLLRLRRGIIGTPASIQLNERNVHRFGYIGDMGSLPTALADLSEVGSQPDFTVDDVTLLGRGWRGPYVATAPADPLLDPWGNAFVYSTTSGTSTFTGAPIVGSIRSTGPDGTASTSDDIVAEIHEAEVFSHVFGYVRRGSPFVAGVNVTVSYPSAGALATITMTTDSGGFFEFSDVPHGDRVFELAPKLAYQDDTAVVSGNSADNVQLIVENLGKDATAITSFTLTYTSSPPAYFRSALIDSNSVFNSTGGSANKGSGDAVTFSSESVTGTGVTQEPLHALVLFKEFHIPDLTVSSVGTGGTLTIDLEDFVDAASGNGTAVDMTGVTFRVDFSDGSVTFLTAQAAP